MYNSYRNPKMPDSWRKKDLPEFWKDARTLADRDDDIEAMGMLKAAHDCARERKERR